MYDMYQAWDDSRTLAQIEARSVQSPSEFENVRITFMRKSLKMHLTTCILPVKATALSYTDYSSFEIVSLRFHDAVKRNEMWTEQRNRQA